MEEKGQLNAGLYNLPEKITRYQLDGRLDTALSRSGWCGEEENIVPAENRIQPIQSLPRFYVYWTDTAPRTYKF
jgi:hypothetical protein